MNTKLFLGLALTVATSLAGAQGRPQPMPPSGQSGSPMSAPQRTNTAKSVSSVEMPETIRLLSLRSVETELGMTQAQWNTLNNIAGKLISSGASEQQSLDAVSPTLSEAQLTRLKELLVQDLGYGSLALNDVRDSLALSSDQLTQIVSLISSYDTVRKALLTSTSDVSKALTQLRTTTNNSLAKVLTAEQDTKIKSLTGKAFSFGN